jgi:hypothetical protein
MRECRGEWGCNCLLGQDLSDSENMSNPGEQTEKIWEGLLFIHRNTAIPGGDAVCKFLQFGARKILF